MALTSGTRFGPYEILGPLGEGGMGEVYRARDPRLNRHVALKLLPEKVAADPERRARFMREAQSVAALNHPHIVGIYSVEEAESLPFLTLELVEGKPLSDHIPKSGLPLEALLKLAIPLADAVSFAHQQGILHRDLKPSNVMVTTDGRPKVLDFGLARLTEAETASATMTGLPAPHLTGEGRVLGTAAYMSPEQAEGRPADQRSDIFSLGVVLYEMATGERPFKGDTPMSTLSAVIRDTPRPATELNPAVPKELGRVIRRCLNKDPEHRYQNAKDLRNNLEEVQQELSSGEIERPPARGGHPGIPVAAGVVIVGLLGVVAFLLWGRRSPSGGDAAPLTGTVRQITTQSGIESTPSLSPDGGWVVYSAPGPRGDQDIFLQAVGGQAAINLTQDSLDSDMNPAFSPSGESIAFRSSRQGGGVFIMGRTGESVRRLTDGAGFCPAWSPDGRQIVYSTQFPGPYARGADGELWIVDVSSGERRRLLGGRDGVQASWSPDGRRIAFWGVRPGTVQRDIFTILASGGDPVAVTDDMAVDWSPIWSADGRFLYFASNRSGVMSIWRIPIDPSSGRPAGEAVPISASGSNLGQLSRSADGRRLAYTSFTPDANVNRVRFDPVRGAIDGEPSPVTRGSVNWYNLDVSPDNTMMALSPLIRQEDVYVGSADGTGSLRQLTNDPAMDRRPRWSPDGSQLAFYSTRTTATNVWLIRPDGSGARALTESATHILYPTWSPDGRRLAYVHQPTGEIHIIDPAKPPNANRLETLPAFENGPGVTLWHWSPDGRTLLLSKGGLVVFDLARRTYERLLPIGGNARWLADSRRFLFTETSEIRLFDMATRRETTLLSLKGQALTQIALPADNRTLYFISNAVEGDVYMIEFPPAGAR